MEFTDLLRRLIETLEDAPERRRTMPGSMRRELENLICRLVTSRRLLDEYSRQALRLYEEEGVLDDILREPLPELPVEDIVSDGPCVLSDDELVALARRYDYVGGIADWLFDDIGETGVIPDVWNEAMQRTREAEGRNVNRTTPQTKPVKTMENSGASAVLERFDRRKSLRGQRSSAAAETQERLARPRERMRLSRSLCIACEWDHLGRPTLYELPGNVFARPVSPGAHTYAVVPTPAKYAGDDEFANEGEDGGWV